MGARVGAAHAGWGEGWFVVGGGRNGVEYSVLLLVCLVALVFDARRETVRRGASRDADAEE